MTDDLPIESPVAGRSPWDLLAQHYAAVLTATYLASAAAGATYHFFLYRAFDLLIFDFWDTGDYLASAVREPQIILYAVLAVVVTSTITWNQQWDSWARSRGAVTHAMFGNYFWERLGISTRNYPLVGTLLGVGFFFVLTYGLADDHAQAIREGRRGVVDAVAEALPDGRLQASLISRTNSFVILVDRQGTDRYVVPLESLGALHFPNPKDSGQGREPGESEVVENAPVPEPAPSTQ